MSEHCCAVASHCTCHLAPGHDGPHECHDDVCGGLWFGELFDGDDSATDDFRPIRFPAGLFGDVDV